MTGAKQRAAGRRNVKKTGKAVGITRRAKIVARLQPPLPTTSAGPKPWEQLRAIGGRLLAKPGESVLREPDFDALR